MAQIYDRLVWLIKRLLPPKIYKQLYMSRYKLRDYWRNKKMSSLRLLCPSDSITVETSCLCNVRCIWCWMYYFDNKKDKGLMSFENFKKFIDLNSEYLHKEKIPIHLNHRGEALLNNAFFEMLDYATKKSVRLKELHTNLSLKTDIKRLVESAIPSFIVNVGGVTENVHTKNMKGSDLELVKNNLREMLRLNKGNKPIFLKMNITKHNVHQIKELPDFFKALGGDPKNIMLWKIECITPAELTEKEKKEFISNIASEEVRDYLEFTYDENGNIKAKVRQCLHINPTISWDGQITVCCEDKIFRLNLGDVFKIPLKTIFKSMKFKNAVRKGRRMGFWFCKECN